MVETEAESGLAHQDWTTVTLKRGGGFVLDGGASNLLPNNKPGCAMSSVTSTPARKIEARIDDPDGTGSVLPKVSRADGALIVAARTARKLTQLQLATHLNMQKKDIQEIECGKAIENRAQLSKIRRYLGIVVQR